MEEFLKVIHPAMDKLLHPVIVRFAEEQPGLFVSSIVGVIVLTLVVSVRSLPKGKQLRPPSASGPPKT